MKPRLAIVASHVIQYQAPLFQRLEASGEVDLTVFYCDSAGSEIYQDRDMKTTLAWDIPLLSGYHYETLRNYSPLGSLNGWGLVNFDLPRRLVKGDFDAVVFMGWGVVSYWLGFALCLFRRIPFFLYGDSSEIPRSHSIRQRVRDRVLRALFARTAGFLVSGRYNADYYQHYGGDETRFFFVPWAVDNDRFERQSRLNEAERIECRESYEITPEAIVILFSGKLLPRKGPMDLLEAFARMPNRERAVLMFVGDGVERERLERSRDTHSLTNVRITGFLNQSILPKIYGMSDVFVLPSYFDPRATVVNEAMAAGLACVVSDRIGPSGDIVRDGENGFVIPAGDIDTLSSRLNQLVAEPSLARRMGECSRAIIGRWSYREDVEGMVAAARFARSLNEKRSARE
ncbi:MAG: glycosyltransferase family 4 protein [Acidobacteriota bacterium]